MRKKKSTGPKRMKELGRKKVEVWFSEAQFAAILKLALRLGLKPATFSRRCANYFATGGEVAAQPIRHRRYD